MVILPIIEKVRRQAWYFITPVTKRMSSTLPVVRRSDAVALCRHLAACCHHVVCRHLPPVVAVENTTIHLNLTKATKAIQRRMNSR